MKAFYIIISVFSIISCLETLQEATATIYLAGDSTVADYKDEQFIAGWGQYLQNFLNDNIKVVNAARNGRSTRSFINEGRLYNIDGNKYKFTENNGKSIDSTIKKGDYLFIQFGHNDDDTALPNSYTKLFDRSVPLGTPINGKFPVTEGVTSSTSVLPKLYVQLATADEQKTALSTIAQYGPSYYAYDCGGTFKWFFKQYIDVARKKGATPVLVTPVSRVTFSKGKIVGKEGRFGKNFEIIQAIKQLAEEEDCLLLDLNAITIKMMETATEDNAGYLMALVPNSLTGSWPSGYDKAYNNKEAGCTGIEGTHYNKFGAYLVAAYAAELIIKQKDEVHNKKESFSFSDYVLTEPKKYVEPSSKMPSEILTKLYKLFSAVKPKK